MVLTGIKSGVENNFVWNLPKSATIFFKFVFLSAGKRNQHKTGIVLNCVSVTGCNISNVYKPFETL